MKEYLLKFSISLSVNLEVQIHNIKEEYVHSVNSDDKFIWDQNEYAWFTINKLNGGTDAYCEKLAEQLSDWETYIEDTLDNIIVTPTLRQQILNCEYEWHFRRSAGHLPLINIAFGHLTAAVAKLTDGYIYTNDGAWTDNIFPTTADQLLEIFLHPDKAKDAADYDWATRCIEGLKIELASR